MIGDLPANESDGGVFDEAHPAAAGGEGHRRAAGAGGKSADDADGVSGGRPGGGYAETESGLSKSSQFN